MLRLFELADRTRLIGEMQADGISLALPINASSADLLASTDPLVKGACPGAWVPVNVAAMDAEADGLSRGFTMARVQGLFVAVVYDNSAPRAATRTFAFTPAELLMVKMVQAVQLSHGADRNTGSRSTLAQETAVRDIIEPFAIAAGQWRKKLVAVMTDLAADTRLTC